MSFTTLFFKIFFLAALVQFSLMVTSHARKISDDVGYSLDDLSSSDRIASLFDSWTEEHGKRYELHEEKLNRFEKFKNNLMYIASRNQDGVGNYLLGLNKFADMSQDEFKQTYLSGRVYKSSAPSKSRYNNNTRSTKIPKYVNWIKQGAVTKVKDLQKCKTDVSKKVIKISGFNDLDAVGNVTVLLAALAKQPVSLGIAVGRSRDFQFYKKGIFDDKKCGIELDHGLTGVGYVLSEKSNYLILKNSWGRHWGEKGFMRMKIINGTKEGLCGIYTMPSVPIIN